MKRKVENGSTVLDWMPQWQSNIFCSMARTNATIYFGPYEPNQHENENEWRSLKDVGFKLPRRKTWGRDGPVEVSLPHQKHMDQFIA